MALTSKRDGLEEPLEPAVSERRLLGFYDGLRAKIAGAVAGRGGSVRSAAASALLLVPDVFILLARLTLDREVPAESRRLLGGALLYFLVPFDLAPEIMLGPVGYLDDLILACVVLAEALGPDLEARATKYWNGPTELRRALGEITRTARSLLGEGLFGRLRNLLARRGLKL